MVQDLILERLILWKISQYTSILTAAQPSHFFLYLINKFQLNTRIRLRQSMVTICFLSNHSNPRLCPNHWCWISWSWTVLWWPTRPSTINTKRKKKKVLFIIGYWNAKVGSQEIPGVTGRFGLGVQNEAGQRLTESCQENALVTANTLFQQQKRRLYTWISPDGQHRNQIDYILCSQRWRSFIQSAKTRPGADCGSDHELLIAKFRLKLEKVGKTT